MIENFQPKFGSVREVSERYPFTEPALRYLIFNSKKNGLDTCLIKIGKRILVDLSAFETWIISHREGKNNA